MVEVFYFVHVLSVFLSLCGFLLRGFWMWQSSPLLNAKLTRVLPHCVDTALLVSSLCLAITWQLNPLQQPWLLSKIIALVLYIGLGTVALKRGKTRAVKITAFIAALITAGFIVGAATTKSPWSWLSLIS